MNKNIYVVTSNISNKIKVEGVFSCYNFAERFCDLENSKLEEFRKQDEGFNIKAFRIDARRVPENQCYKKHWDYAVNINKDVQDFGKILYAGDGKELVDNRKLQDVEIYDGEYIYCRSYISKQECEQLAKEQWEIFEQKQIIKGNK